MLKFFHSFHPICFYIFKKSLCFSFVNIYYFFEDGKSYCLFFSTMSYIVVIKAEIFIVYVYKLNYLQILNYYSSYFVSRFIHIRVVIKCPELLYLLLLCLINHNNLIIALFSSISKVVYKLPNIVSMYTHARTHTHTTHKI